MISFIIPNYNRFDLLINCIKSIRKQSIKTYEIIIIDNGSKDFDSTYNFGENVKVIINKTNLGFAKAVNIGIAHSTGKYIVLLNNDTELDINWCENVLDFFSKTPEADYAASKILNFYDRQIIDDVEDVLLPSGKVYKIGFGEADHGQYDSIKKIFSASGAACILKRDLINHIGFLEEEFFSYLEDVDFYFRAILLGYKGFFIPNAKVYHIGSATTGSTYNHFTVFYLARNTVLLILKNLPISLIIKYFPYIIFHYITMFSANLLRGYGTDFLRGTISAFSSIKIILSRRKEIMKKRILSNKEINSILYNNIKLYKTSKLNKKKLAKGCSYEI